MKIKNFLLLAFLVVSVQFAKAQETQPLDGAYIEERTLTRKFLPYSTIREADVLFKKRVWRILDMREKMNMPLYYPPEPANGLKSLATTIFEALNTGELMAYSAWFGATQDDEFRSTLSKNELKAAMSVIEQIETFPYEDDPEYSVLVDDTSELETSEILMYKIKEDWIFDTQRSKLEVRIIGLAPMKATKDGEVLIGYQEMFWLYYPYCRPVFAHQEVFNRNNDGAQLTIDDVFQNRMFSSYIVKEKNTYNRAIEDYKKGLDALLESDRITNDLRNKEIDLWVY